MHFSSALLALLSATGVSALAAPHPMITAPPVMQRDVFDSLRSVIDGAESAASTAESLKSSLKGDVSSLKSAASSLFTDAKQSLTCVSLASAILDSHPPTPTGDLASIVASARATASNNCIASAVPASLSAAFAQYEASAATWYAKVSPLASSYVQSCPTAEGLEVSLLAPCSTALKEASVAGTTTAASGSKGATTGASATGSEAASATGTAAATAATAAASKQQAALVILGLAGAVALA